MEFASDAAYYGLEGLDTGAANTFASANESLEAGTGAGAGAGAGTAGSAFDFASFNPADYGVQGSEKTAALEKFAGILGGGGTLSESQQNKLEGISGRTGVDFGSLFGLGSLNATGTTGAATTPSWVATAADQYQYLNPYQESKLGRLSEKYASGALEGREGKIEKLEELLGKANLGTLESYFSKDSAYTDPTNLDIALPTGVTYQNIADIFRGDDPLRGYATAERLGLTPEQILGITGGYQTNYYNPAQSLADIEDFLAAGRSQLADRSLAVQYINNPNSQIFIDNPGLVSRAQSVIYAYQNPITEPITSTITNQAGKEVAGSGQYGYVNNAPILNAEIIDTILGDRNQIGGKTFDRFDEILDELGWNFQSDEGLNRISRGVSVVGLDEDTYSPYTLALMDSNAFYTDPETGVVSDAYANERQALNTAAEKIGIDPSEFDSATELYQAVSQATDGLYMVVGQYKNQWDPDEISGISDRGNHASVLYREYNGQLIPISDPNLFKYTKPDDPIVGGKIGEMIAGIPFLPQIAGLMSGGNPAVIAAVSALQAGSRSGDIGDMATAAGLSYLTTTIIPKITPEISQALANNSLMFSIAEVSPDLANFLVKAGTNATISMGIATLLGKDPLETGVTSLISSGVMDVTKSGLDLTGIPDQYKPIVSRIISDVILGNDPKNSVTGAVTGMFTKEVSDFIKTLGEQQGAKNTEIKV